MTIHFKNGVKKEVSQEIVATIVKEMEQGKGMAYQVFTDPQTGVFLVINMSEVALID